jgi:aryl-alcohol dehydrogenase-like predicted oxidoreductase
MPLPERMPRQSTARAPDGAAVRLGASSVSTTPIGLGTAALGASYGAPGFHRAAPPTAVAIKTIERALEAGITLIDTAPAYGAAESIVGEACADVDCVIATKLAIPAGGWSRLSRAAIADHVRRSAETSLAALRRPRIDLLQVHNADAQLIASGEVPAALMRLRSEGLITACGATVYGEQNALAAVTCSAFDTVQIAYSALDQRSERTVVRAAAEHTTTLIARSVLLRGVLSPAGRSLTGAFAPLAEAADHFRVAVGASWEQLPGAAVAFALTRPGIGCTLVGPRDDAELHALLEVSAGFLASARELQGDWGGGLPAELLDPSLWPEDG